MVRGLLASISALALTAAAVPAFAGMEEAKKWIEQEFQPSTLSIEDRRKEMEWFVKAATPFNGMEINVLSGTIPTHEYESKTPTKAFEEITGIKVNHQLLGEGEVVQVVQTQMQTNRNLYDAYINDSELIGTHSRLQLAANLTDWMAGEGKDVTNPMLDVDDFIGKSFTTGPDGKLYQLPDQQFASLYRFREDWFDRADLKKRSRTNTGTSSACRSIGRPTRTSPNSSPTTSRKSTASASTATWTTASAPPISAGGAATIWGLW
jgi:glycerol transport system substrate-binding protein